MRKAINFDLDTKKYEKATKKPSPTAYAEIKQFLKENGFEHRQGSGYISKESLTDARVSSIVQNMSIELEWLKECVEQIDVTNIGKQHSLIYTVQNATKENEKSNLEDMEI